MLQRDGDAISVSKEQNATLEPNWDDSANNLGKIKSRPHCFLQKNCLDSSNVGMMWQTLSR
jgi:hypothetical protein